MMEIDVIGVPLWEGSGRIGPQTGPAVLIADGLEERIARQGHHCHSCEVMADPTPSDLDEADLLYYAPTVMECCKELEKRVDRSLTQGGFPLVVGGDHALAIGSLSGVNHHIPAEDLTVIWVDAHTDINTDTSSDSHHIHGMPVAACLGLGDDRLIDGFGKDRIKILPQNLFYIGARSVDDGEWEILKEHNIRVYTMEEVKERGMSAVVNEIVSNLKTPWLHVSFDVDFMDADEFSATGLPIPDGPSVDDTRLCLTTLLSCGKVSSMDFVEYNPRWDREDKGLKVCSGLMEDCLKALNNETQHPVCQG